MFSILMKNNFLYERFIGCQKHGSYSLAPISHFKSFNFGSTKRNKKLFYHHHIPTFKSLGVTDRCGSHTVKEAADVTSNLLDCSLSSL